MKFPEKPRTIYERNPLTEVVCQLRFPRVFLLDERVPAEFQKSLGRGYPHVETRETANFAVTGPVSSPMVTHNRVIYDFASSDRTMVISVCSEFIAFRAAPYGRWEDFIAHIRVGVDALFSSYSIPNFSRTGLHYVNAVDRDKLGLLSEKWAELIRSSALGLLGDEDLGNDIFGYGSSTLLHLEKGSVAIHCGLVADELDKPPKYVIDADFYYDQPVEGLDDTFSLLTDYNRAARNAFQWFIKEKLHNALGPGGQ